MMSGVEGIIVLDKTPFYAEMGGQIGDTGVIRCGEAVFEVTDVQKNKGGKFMHTGKVIHGSFQLGDTVTASLMWSAAWPSAAATRPPICSTPRSRRCSATTCIRPVLLLRARPSALRLHAF